MHEQHLAIATLCLESAYADTADFPTVVRRLMQAGFESYEIDYRRSTATYFLPSGESCQLTLPKAATPVAATFSATAIAQAVQEAQAKAPGYTYAGFCATVKAAGCAGYMVSFLGKRVVYYGRTAETHVEHFPS